MNIAFIGGMSTGKTTHADLLVKVGGFTRISLADPIREMEACLDDIPYDEILMARLASWYLGGIPGYTLREELTNMVEVLLEAKTIAREFPKPRTRLQFIGTEGGRRRVDPDIWIKLLRARIHDPANAGKNWVIDDIRFMNEYTKLLGLFIPVKLVLPYDVQLSRIKALYPDLDIERALAHESETDSRNIILPEDQTFSTEDDIGVVHTRILQRIYR